MPRNQVVNILGISKIWTNEKAFLKAAESGAFRDHYLIYNRKSTDEPNNQKNSIQYQKAENLRFAKRFHLPIANITAKGFSLNGIISEKHSGFKEDSTLHFGKNGTVQYNVERPKFYRLVQYLNKGYFKGVIVLCWDRVSRNKGDNTIIEKLMKQGCDFRFTLATYDKTSSGALHMDIDSMFAEHHSRVTSEKVSLNIENQRSKGICTYKAPVGYLNTGTMEHKPFDPIRSPLIRQLFELYATGMYSLADLARWSAAHGMTMPPVRRRRTEEEVLAEEEDEVLLQIEAVERPLTYNNIHKILTNPFYTGRILGTNKEYIQSASHKRLISDELFEKVQHKLGNKRVSLHYTQKLNHLYRGLLRCGVCSRSYTPYTKKGILYFGAKCAKECSNSQKNINLAFLEEKIGCLIANLSFTEDEFNRLEATTETDIALLDQKRITELDMQERQKRKLREDLTYLNANRLLLLRSGVYTPETFIAEETRLYGDIASLQGKEQVSDISMFEVIKEIIELSELLKSLYFYYKNAVSEEREDYVRKIFSELSLSENTLRIKCKNGLQVLESRFYSVGDPTGWISELNKYSIEIETSVEIIKRLFD
ncbi:MAG: recombinase family protein [Taibaiella sp.]|nr:recombinase family protein [Taibaiella sp.]